MVAAEIQPQPRAALGDRPAPTPPSERIATLDIVRGLAVLGILAVNVFAFAFPSAVYMNPALAPFPLEGSSAVAMWASDTFFHSKFITLFSMLFGASIFLVGGDKTDPARNRLILRRLLWLIPIALIHGLFLWFGDVLLLYAAAGLIAMLFRGLKACTLIWIGLGITLLLAVLAAGGALALQFAPPEMLDQIEQQKSAMTGSREAVQASIANYRSGWPGMLTENFKAWSQLQIASLLFIIIPTVALMMFGMGLLKAGFFSGRAPTILYVLLVLIGGAVLAATGWLGWREMVSDGATRGLHQAVEAFAVLITLGYASLLILLVTRGARVLVGWLAPVGRMAFTNYLTQSLIMTTLFYQPWGPKLMGTMDRPALWGVVAAVWALQIVWSALWLSRFQMGPLEWLWRCLTYGRMVPMGRA
jgi:uncharacterized protein